MGHIDQYELHIPLTALELLYPHFAWSQISQLSYLIPLLLEMELKLRHTEDNLQTYLTF